LCGLKGRTRFPQTGVKAKVDRIAIGDPDYGFLLEGVKRFHQLYPPLHTVLHVVTPFTVTHCVVQEGLLMWKTAAPAAMTSVKPMAKAKASIRV
jgi:hypothetical protein